MHGAVAPPRPDFFGDERQERREEPQHHRQRRGQRGVRRAGAVGALFAVAPALHELEIVVAEPPEECLGPLQHARVVVGVERASGLHDQCRQIPDHRAIDRSRNDRG